MEKVRITAIIAEFNPLHPGHKYIIRNAREVTGATHILVIQSSNFCQRAEPSIQSKHERAEAAIRAGADAVVEIPSAYSTGNAEVFAKAGIKIATSFPHVTNLVFGIESQDISIIKKIATIQVKREKDFEKYMQGHLKKGISFDKARCEVIKKLLPKIPADVIERTMNTPNNILGIEYLKELTRLKSPVVPIGITRIKTKSATDIRHDIVETSPYRNPEKSQFLSKYNFDVFGSSMLFAIMTKLTTEIYNSNEELVNLIKNLHPISYTSLKRDAPTKRFSVSRIARLALHCALDVTKRDVQYLYDNEWLPYTNLLAINIAAESFFSALCLNTKTPLVVRGNKIRPKATPYYKALRAIDEKSDLLYEAICGERIEKRPRFVSVTNLALEFNHD
ncbi:MAG: nucleotidyltransferase family protein [Firmicutes bacterium]|nr:nucleotidyltransferase family protein [Bacillota bacterium]